MTLKDYIETRTRNVPMSLIDGLVDKLTDQIVAKFTREIVRDKIYKEVMREIMNDPERAFSGYDVMNIHFNVDAQAPFKEIAE